ncbi:MAG TPA: hypothetical protein VMU64_07475 [Acidimicrobiales bacterium]|nr:hypothetical protein [Acidimicrobiales bacterium]
MSPPPGATVSARWRHIRLIASKFLEPGNDLGQGRPALSLGRPPGELEVEPGIDIVGISRLSASSGGIGLELTDQTVQVRLVV